MQLHVLRCMHVRLHVELSAVIDFPKVVTQETVYCDFFLYQRNSDRQNRARNEENSVIIIKIFNEDARTF